MSTITLLLVAIIGITTAHFFSVAKCIKIAIYLGLLYALRVSQLDFILQIAVGIVLWGIVSFIVELVIEAIIDKDPTGPND